VLVALLAAAGCGGQSLGHVDDDGGAGAPEGGTSGTGAAGSNTAGTSSGGGPTGGTGGGSTGGGGGICSLPIESGPCLAYAPSFGFSAADGNCQPFVYGGCEGNPNRFATLAECEAQCGGGTLSRCPPTVPSTALGGCALGAALFCTYDEVGCLCAPTRTQSCNRTDPDCGNVQAIPGEPPGGDPIVCTPYTLCSCGTVTSDAAASWSCQPGCGFASR
jgi:hypothetical protein